ncbi:MAG: hypothetical protein AB1792_07730 [Candidatus Zixiibacteriota bacterium]
MTERSSLHFAPLARCDHGHPSGARIPGLLYDPGTMRGPTGTPGAAGKSDSI